MYTAMRNMTGSTIVLNLRNFAQVRGQACKDLRPRFSLTFFSFEEDRVSLRLKGKGVLHAVRRI